MKTMVRAPALMAVALSLALWAAWATTNPTVGELVGRGPQSAVACLICAGGGIAAVMYSGGTVAWLLWTRMGTAAAVFCGASCLAAVM